jgi:hypothetical protein
MSPSLNAGSAAATNPGSRPGITEGVDTMTDEDRRQPHRGGESGPRRHGRHRWMMLACFVPLLVVAAALIFTGAVGTGSVVFAVACITMMAVMAVMMLAMR